MPVNHHGRHQQAIAGNLAAYRQVRATGNHNESNTRCNDSINGYLLQNVDQIGRPKERLLRQCEEKEDGRQNNIRTVFFIDFPKFVAHSFFAPIYFSPDARSRMRAWLNSALGTIPACLPSQMTTIRSDIPNSSGISEETIKIECPSSTS